MPESVTDTLEQIQDWLTARSPAVQSSLREPATTAELERIQYTTGLQLLPPVEELYRWHNGCLGVSLPFWLAPDFGFLTLGDAADEWRTYNEVVAQNFADPSEAAWLWSREWMPIGSAWAGSILVVDHAPRPTRGTVFPVQHGNGARRDLAWTSMAVLLQELLNTLTTGTPMRDRHLTVSSDKLEWD